MLGPEGFEPTFPGYSRILDLEDGPARVTMFSCIIVRTQTCSKLCSTAWSCVPYSVLVHDALIQARH